MTHRRTYKTAVWPLAAVGALLAAGVIPAWAQGVRLGSVRIVLRATPTTVPADGKTASRVRIEVRDKSDRPMPDGTPIFCTVDNGLLSTSDAEKRESLTVNSAGGYAIVSCTSVTPGAATVVVRVQDSRNEITVQFLPEGEAAQNLARVVNVRGGCVGYCLDLGVIRAREGARAQIGNLTFDATDGLEVRIDDRTMRGWGVRISRKTEKLQGEDFFFDLARQRGVLRRFGENGVERVFFNAYSLAGGQRGWELPDDAFRRDDREGGTWLVCKSCSFFLGQKVVVKHAALYAGPQKVMSFPPYWVIGLPGYTGASNTQVIGASSDGGLAIDFPFFFQVTDDWAGAVKIQRGAAGSSFIAREGWSLGLAEEYDTGTGVKGCFEAGGLLRNDWGLEWRDERPLFGDSQGFFNVGWPDHQSLFADANIYRYTDGYRFSFRGQYDNPALGSETAQLTADWLTESRKLSSTASYRLGLSLGTRHDSSNADGWVFQNELYSAVDLKPWRLGRTAQLTPSATNVYSWDTSGFSSNTAQGQLRLAKSFGRPAHLGLNYYIDYRTGDATPSGVDHSLGLDFNLTHGTKWNAFLNGTWDMTLGDTYGYLAFDYYVKTMWRLGLMATHYDTTDTNYNDLEFALARSVGSREIGLHYSVDTHQLALELGGLGLNP